MDYILTLTTQEKIFSRYLYEPDLKKSYTNPFRVDEKPGCTFYYKGKKLYFVDWSWSKKHYDCFNVVQEYYKCGITKALKHIKEDLDKGEILPKTLTESHIEKQKKTKLGVKTRDFNEQELAFWNVGGLIITQEILNKNGIYAVSIIFENDWVIEHCKMTFAYIVDGVVMQIYFPKNKGTTKRRFASRAEFVMGGLSELPFVSNYCVIGKGFKCSFFMKQLDIVNMFIVTESVVLERDIYEMLEMNYGTVFFMGDNDYPGRRLAVKMRQAYPSCIILLFPHGEPKDFTDNLSAYGMLDMIEMKESIERQFLC